MKNLLLLISFFLLSIFSSAQETGKIKGKVINASNRNPLPFVNVILIGTSKGTTTNDKGEFEILNVPLGYNKVQASFVGFKSVISDEYLVTNDNTPFIKIKMDEDSNELQEVVIKSKLFKKSIVNPISTQSLGIAEIEKNPGGDRDVLKVLQSLPGVASNPGFRNDIIIRGGATSENKFYLDGIEVPVINHFQTQGATGGPVGIINTDLIRKVDFLTSAFPANRGNALSSVVEFTQKTGNTKKFKARATLGTSDAGITINGPLSNKTTYIFSVRQSYLQFLFKALKLPFLPTYNDFQLNIKSELSANSELSIIGLGAIDNFKLNKRVNDGETDATVLKKNNYILNNIPIQNQWNYTVGAKYDYFSSGYKHQFVLSRNEWKNKTKKYKNNSNNIEDLIADYQSKETENKFRYELDFTSKNNYSFNLGTGLQQVTYTNATYQKFANATGERINNFSSELTLFKYAMFSQVSKSFFNKKLGLSLGIRFDGNTYNNNMGNILNQFSPRLSASYALSEKLSLNSTAGIYYQLPSYTTLGFRNNTNILVNKPNLKYIQAKHLVAGIEYNPDYSSKITMEGFYKKYSNYPFSTENNISLANLGSDFGVVGNEQVTSTSQGRAYGLEILAQKKSYKGLYGILSYTFVRSEFKNQLNAYIPSSWDNKHLLTLTAGTKLKRNWEVGGKFRLVGGKPYTPYNYEASANIKNYNLNSRGIIDYTKLNSKRFNTYTQLDFRVDKTWFLKKLAINLYVDIQNVYASESNSLPYLIPKVDTNGNRLIDTNDNSKYILEEVKNKSGRLLPKLGVIIDF